MNIKFQVGLFLPLVGCLLCIQPASAQSATVTAGGTSTPNTFPFGTDGPPTPSGVKTYSGEYQQIYSASAFTSPVTITQVSFSSAASADNVAETATYNFTIKLANTSASVTGTDPNFVSTAGGVTVFQGMLNANLLANNTFDLNIPFMNTFTYTPGSQNLLLDVFITSATSTNQDGTSQPDLFQAGNGSVRSIFYSNGTPSSPTNTAQSGLLTQFTTTPAAAPEPSSVLSLLLGIGGVALACGLKASKRKSHTA